MRPSILNRLFASGGCGYGSELGGRMVMSTMSKVGASTSTSPSPSPSPPWLMLPPDRGSSGGIQFNFYKLAEQKQVSLDGGFPLEAADSIRFVGSSHGWLALFNDRTKDLFLTNPVSGRRITLPPTENTVSRVVLSCSPDDDEDECRAVMSFATPPAKTRAAKTLAAYLPAMNLGPAGSLAFSLLNKSPAWTPISTEDRVTCYGDFVYSRKQGYLFCLTTNYSPEIDKLGFDDTRVPNLSDVEVWDLTNPESPRIERRHSLNELPRLVRDSTGVSERRYLVFSEPSDQLYLIRRHMMERVEFRGGDTGKFVKDIYFRNRKGWDNSYPYKTVAFDIHMIDNDGKLLMDEKVSLDNVAIFIGINHGLVMETDQFDELNSNSIYFTDDTIHTPPNDRDVVDGSGYYWHIFVGRDSKWAHPSSLYGGHDIGIFDCENKTISPCFFPTDPPSLKRIDPPPLWFTPDSRGRGSHPYIT